jgi:A/G-specific adenine glycosylase
MLTKHDFTNRLLTWYDQEARILPWRSNPTPYRVWISEMMLQQTRVETVIPFFNRFLAEIPDIQALAEIHEDKLLKLWQGLGYYSRAINLKKAAMILQSEYGGILPSDRKILQKLPGIGPYSAGAISSIAFQQVETLMDGNVLRVIARLKGIDTDIGDKGTQGRIQEILEALISEQRPGDFNQALMELGATRCLPNGMPLCMSCPVSNLCVANLQGRTTNIPMKSAKKPREIQRQTVLLLCHNHTYGIEKRKNSGLLAKMWAFPMLEGNISKDACIAWLKDSGYEIANIASLPAAKHIFTHIEWEMIGYEVELQSFKNHWPLTWATKEQLETQYAIPTAHSFYMKYVKQ